VEKPGYHLKEIARGVLGETSKIREELEELQDAEQQGVKLMALIELADMLGAMCAYLERHHPGYTLDDLVKMKDVNKRAFENGHRQSREPKEIVVYPPRPNHMWAPDHQNARQEGPPRAYCVACYDAFNRYMGAKEGPCPGRKVG
jgi:hypothetical protein